MKRQTIIVLLKIKDYPDFYSVESVETWGNLKEACEAHDWRYHTISRKELPAEWDGWLINRCKFKPY